MDKVIDQIKITVFGNDLDQEIRDEISLWHRVKYVDINKDVLCTTSNTTKQIPASSIIPLLVEYLFEEELAERIIYIESGHLFSTELLAEVKNDFDLKGEGFHIYNNFNRTCDHLISVRNQVDNYQVKQEYNETHVRLPRVNKDSKWSCSIKIRKELIYSSLFTDKAEAKQDEGIALLIPTKSINNVYNDNSFIKHFIPSFLETVSRDGNVSFYLGYDRGDPIYSKNDNRENIKALLTGFKVVFIELPHSGGWLTFIWNYLFVRAYADGNEYFFQLNDDLQFQSRGWIDSSISMIKNRHYDVIGLKDLTWECKLYTQSLVTRRHYEIFAGNFFPLELRNWYSDNWITFVYGENRRGCNGEAIIRNGQGGTSRYESCDDRNYLTVLNRDKKEIIKQTNLKL